MSASLSSVVSVQCPCLYFLGGYAGGSRELDLCVYYYALSESFKSMPQPETNTTASFSHIPFLKYDAS